MNTLCLKKVGAGLVLSAFVGSAFAANVHTGRRPSALQRLQAQVNALQAQVNTLKSQVGVPGPQGPMGPPGPVGATGPQGPAGSGPKTYQVVGYTTATLQSLSSLLLGRPSTFNASDIPRATSLCASEYPGSRISKSEELFNYDLSQVGSGIYVLFANDASGSFGMTSASGPLLSYGAPVNAPSVTSTIPLSSMPLGTQANVFCSTPR